MCLRHGCSRTATAGGLCDEHGVCSHPGCSRTATAGGFCDKHGGQKQTSAAPGKKTGKKRKREDEPKGDDGVDYDEDKRRHSTGHRSQIMPSCPLAGPVGGRRGGRRDSDSQSPMNGPQGKKCKKTNCNRNAVQGDGRRGTDDFCSNHQPRRMCNAEGCTNFVVQGGVCISHGAKCKSCKVKGCNTRSRGPSYKHMCKKHFNGQRICKVKGCNNLSQGGHNHHMCEKHFKNGGEDEEAEEDKGDKYLPVYTCPLCRWTCDSNGGLQRHCNSKHKSEAIDANSIPSNNISAKDFRNRNRSNWFIRKDTKRIVQPGAEICKDRKTKEEGRAARARRRTRSGKPEGRDMAIILLFLAGMGANSQECPLIPDATRTFLNNMGLEVLGAHGSTEPYIFGLLRALQRESYWTNLTPVEQVSLIRKVVQCLPGVTSRGAIVDVDCVEEGANNDGVVELVTSAPCPVDPSAQNRDDSHESCNLALADNDLPTVQPKTPSDQASLTGDEGGDENNDEDGDEDGGGAAVTNALVPSSPSAANGVPAEAVRENGGTRPTLEQRVRSHDMTSLDVDLPGISSEPGTAEGSATAQSSEQSAGNSRNAALAMMAARVGRRRSIVEYQQILDERDRQSQWDDERDALLIETVMRERHLGRIVEFNTALGSIAKAMKLSEDSIRKRFSLLTRRNEGLGRLATRAANSIIAELDDEMKTFSDIIRHGLLSIILRTIRKTASSKKTALDAYNAETEEEDTAGEEEEDGSNVEAPVNDGRDVSVASDGREAEQSAEGEVRRSSRSRQARLDSAADDRHNELDKHLQDEAEKKRQAIETAEENRSSEDESRNEDGIEETGRTEGAVLSEYELLRQRKIARNEAKLVDLGLWKPSTNESPPKSPPKKKDCDSDDDYVDESDDESDDE